MIEIISYPLIFIFVWISSFLIHELMHIKSQGLNSTGKIYVDIRGMTCTADNVINGTWFGLAGGILTSIIMFIMVFYSSGFLQWSFLTLGFVHLFYGLYEGIYGVKYRYLIYIAVVVIMMIIWMLL